MDVSQTLSPGQSLHVLRAHRRWMALYLAAVALARWWISPALEFDEAEQALHLQQLMGGYGAQPPGFEWVMQGLTALGVGLSPAMLGFKALLLWLVYAATTGLVRDATGDVRLAVACGYAVFLLPQLAWEAPRTLTHTVLATACVAVAAFAMHRVAVSERPRARDVLLLGLACGAGLLSKHSFVASIGLFALVLLLREWAASPRPTPNLQVAGWRPRLGAVLAAMGLAVLIASPHLLWLLTHAADVAAIIQSKLAGGSTSAVGLRGVQSWSQLVAGLSGLLVGLAGFWIVPAILIAATAWVAHRRRTGPSSASWLQEVGRQRLEPVRRLLGQHALLFLLLCLALVLWAGATSFRDRWLTPFLFLTPALAVLLVAGIDRVEARLIRVAQGFLVLVGALLILRVPLGPMLGKPGWLNVPVDAIAQAVAQVASPRAVILVDNIQVAGGLKLHLPDHAVYQAGSTFTHLAKPQACEFLLVHAPSPTASHSSEALAGLRQAMAALAGASQEGATHKPWRWSGTVLWGTAAFEVVGERWTLPCASGRFEAGQNRPEAGRQRASLVTRAVGAASNAPGG